MKAFYFFMLLTAMGLAAKAQGSSQTEMIREDVSISLVENIGAIPINESANVLKRFSSDKQKNYQKADLALYRYSIMKKGDKEVLQVHALPIGELKNAANESNFTIQISYNCTDTSHNPKHDAQTLNQMKAVQTVKHCSGIKMVIHDN
ncbi:hypothetical protein DYU05_07055 [Mucilaginibacter terrenus]|uniref:Uncharacterized protein n=1 Tax=Mucilaginibacter terrenus TaxID=2482727 RepID=A0A3E2NWK6_9SPHI|nr:hypothetical protein [Mucilaginibacter terrenus]RFZ85349.1 hypothetical protein DYU05_07055 [Mucilaginibacter terrenus]